MDMYKACTNKWILLNTTEECIDKIKFYNKDNEILENMISQMKKDAEIGHKMIDKRKLEAGVQNAKLNGNIDTEKLNYYFENM